jgi:hypothetical protein
MCQIVQDVGILMFYFSYCKKRNNRMYLSISMISRIILLTIITIYSGTCVIRHLSFSEILWHLTKIYGPKVFLLTKIKHEYSNILYNLTHFPGPLVCRIRQVLLYYPWNHWNWQIHSIVSFLAVQSLITWITTVWQSNTLLTMESWLLLLPEIGLVW